MTDLKSLLIINTLSVSATAGEQFMKRGTASKKPSPDGPKHPQPAGGAQQALAEKSANNTASVKARVESNNMPDKPPLILQNMPNSSGRK